MYYMFAVAQLTHPVGKVNSKVQLVFLIWSLKQNKPSVTIFHKNYGMKLMKLTMFILL